MINLTGKDKRALNLMLAQTKQFIIFNITTVCIILLSITSLLILKSFVDVVMVANEFKKISLHVIPFILVFVLLCGFMLLRTRAKALLASSIVSYLIKESYKAILTSDINEASNKDVKKLVHNVLKNSDIIANHYISNQVLPFIENLTLLIGLLLACLVIQPVFGLIMLFLIPFYFVFCKGIEIFALKMSKANEESKKQNQEKLNYSYDLLKNIKLLNGQAIETESIDELTKTIVVSNSYKEVLNVLYKTILAILFTGLLLSISLGLGGVLLEAGNKNLSSGTFIFYGLSTPLFFILLYRTFHFELRSEVTSKAEDEIIKLTLLRSEGKNEPVINLDDIHIVKFKDIEISNGKNKIIKDLSFEVRRGEKIGIYAVSKEEKDAIFDAFTKLSKQNNGEISINNCDIAKIGASYLRGVISSIFTDSCIFDETFISNISYPNSYDDYKYNDALNRSGLKDYVSLLPQKENTIINKNLNVKELLKIDYNEFEKRIIFANAFYKDSKIYLLNDTTNDLDASIESELLDEVFKLKNKITIMLTSKTYLLSKCDKVLILEDGKMTEYGKVSELLNDKESYFYKLIKKVPISKVKIS